MKNNFKKQLFIIITPKKRKPPEWDDRWLQKECQDDIKSTPVC
jgi:hypothetical protein